MWVFFIVSASLTAQAQVDSLSALVYKLVYFPELNPVGPNLRPVVIKKIERARKKADWTRQNRNALDSLDLLNLDNQTQTLLQKLNAAMIRQAFLDSVMSHGSQNELTEALASNTTFSIAFAQARVKDVSISNEDVKSRLEGVGPNTQVTKKEQGGVIINIERIAEFGAWHPQFKELIGAKESEVLGPFSDGGSTDRLFLKLFDRQKNQDAGEEEEGEDDTAELHAASLWKAHVDSLIGGSTLRNIKLQPAYFGYSDHGKTLSPNDTLGVIDTIPLLFKDLILHQESYERFVLSPDTSEFLYNLRNYFITPFLIDQKFPFQPSAALSGQMKTEVEIRFRSTKVYSEMVNNTSVTDKEVEQFYKNNKSLYSKHGTCSYLIAYVHDKSKMAQATSRLKELLKSGVYSSEMKKKEKGFTVKFEDGFNLDQNTEKAVSFRNLAVGKPKVITADNGSLTCLLLTAKSDPKTMPLDEVKNQIASELRMNKIAEIEKQFKE